MSRQEMVWIYISKPRGGFRSPVFKTTESELDAMVSLDAEDLNQLKCMPVDCAYTDKDGDTWLRTK